MKISILHPSRSRPEKAIDTALYWLNRIGNVDYEYILSLDTNDPKKDNYLLGLSRLPKYRLTVNPNRSAVDAINIAAEQCQGDLMIVLSDDFKCPDNWGGQLYAECRGHKDFILKTVDGIQKWIITMPIMDRTYYNRFKYIYHPGYLHMFCDTELTCVADLLERRVDSKLEFKHEHYSVMGGTRDEVAIKADGTWAQGEKLFIERYKKTFGLINTKGQIKDQDYQRWIRSKL